VIVKSAPQHMSLSIYSTFIVDMLRSSDGWIRQTAFTTAALTGEL
jgi:hypothetical protein